MPDRHRDPESAAARRRARYGVPAPLPKLLERCAGLYDRDIGVWPIIVDLFIDRLFLKCSIREALIDFALPMLNRCCTNACERSASSSVSDLSAGRRHLGLELAKANVHRASQHDRRSLGCPAIFRGSQR